MAGGREAAMAGAAAGAARSRSLFLWDDGRPMRFYVRPGAAKLRLAPLVLAGGGRLCRVQEPGAVLLAEPGEAAPGGAVSTEYVTECVERNERLPLEPFVLPAPPPAAAAAATASRGRLAFTEAEDAALLRAVRDGGAARAGGRALWMELERSGLTRHSWQAMRDRFLRHLRPLLGEPLQAEESSQVSGLFAANNQEFESAESESDTSDVSELSTQDGGGNSPGETASDLKSGLEDSAFPDTQLQREERPTSTSSSGVVGEVVKTMQQFMEKFSVDLFTVTQAFLKNSGEVEATSDFLQMGQRLDGYPVWSREDDLELQKDDEHVRNKLIAKFGAENVAKRIAFRKS
ncbi:telomeric repeat-binding factor 2-interacting protein 1 [Chiroxiphia lanceolata]|uniref:telomeric repeat-binding factor 2-interacting protein 1 n=1 Tax=Chiroxiphia lanceolata TaxID=296741 RepID=UPI0013CE53F5|nr:telomeric repeat-binding factor 2-interacting protein 1 [Chiroxiphia lanceolata]